MRRLGPTTLVLLALSCQGCQIVWKGSYWDDVKAQKVAAEPEGLAPEVASAAFLGVRVNEEPGPYELGLRIRHVFGGSAAARVGLEEGDELRSLRKVPVRTARDLRTVLAHVQTGERIPVVYARDGQERELKVALVRWADYLKERRKRIFADAAYGGTSFPFFFSYVTRELTPAFLKLYFGATVTEPILVYQDLDVFPLWTTGIGPYRREWLGLYDCSRTRILSWPLQISTMGPDRTGDLNGLLPPQPPGVADL